MPIQTGDPPVELPFLGGVPYGGVITQLILFVVGFVAVYLIGKTVVVPLFRRTLSARKMDEHARKPLIKILNIAIVFVAFGVAFGTAGFGSFLSSLATIGAAATLAIGFATQDVMKNFVSGIFVFIEKPFKIGDWIEWDGYSGVVEDISLRVTRVRTFDNELLTVPNSQLTGGVVKNPVAKDRLRLKFVFGIGYDDDIDQATDIIIEEAEKDDGIMDSPSPSVRVSELADSYVGLQSRIWINDPGRSDYVKTRSEYVQRVKERFDEEGIEMPFPKRDLGGSVEVTGDLGVGDE
ncbi:MAG: mechanosensitive ion channel family protein [Halobacteria archaeon]|nr:mechanosensitive ion channel family protein [Halobacteria archaeon]